MLYIITHTISKDQGKWREKKWSQNHLGCPNDPRDSELDDDDNKVHIALCKRPKTFLYSTKEKVWHVGYTRHCHTVIVVNTVIYLLMFWVPLSINTYQKGNSCRFYHTRPAILVTLTVMSSFLCTVIPTFFDELLSWLGKWTVLCQSCLFAAVVCSSWFQVRVFSWPLRSLNRL